MLEYKYFKDYIKNNLVYSMPKKVNGLTFKEVDNGKYSLHIIKRDKVVAKVDMAGIYKKYSDGDDIDTILKNTAQKVYDKIILPNSSEVRETILNNVIIGIIEQSSLKEDMIWDEFLDYAIVYMIVRKTEKEITMDSISYELITHLDITIDELKHTAMLNTLKFNSPKIYTFDENEDLLSNPGEIPSLIDITNNNNADDIKECLVTGEKNVLGSSAIVFEFIAEKLTHLMGGDYYILPINSDEVFVLHDDEFELYSLLEKLKLMNPFFKDVKIFKRRVYKYISSEKKYKKII